MPGPFLAAPSDVPGAGRAQWAQLSGKSPSHPMVGGPRVPGLHGFDVDRGRARPIITDPGSQIGPVAGAPIMTGPGTDELAAGLESWRDIYNFRGSPMPWLLLMALIFLGLMQFRVQARVAGRSASAALG